MEEHDIITLSSDDESKSSVQVTSPKLSLKRNRTELTPDKKCDERSENGPTFDSVAKRIKFEDQDMILNDGHSSRHHNTSPSSLMPAQIAPNSSVTSTIQVIDLSDNENVSVPFVERDSSREEFYASSSCDMPFNEIFNENKNVFEERNKKFIELLEFSEKLMLDDKSSYDEVLTIENKLKQFFKNAEKSYIESQNFNLLLNISLKKMKRQNTHVYDILNVIKKELKKHRYENRNVVNENTESIKITSNDESLSSLTSVITKTNTTSIPLPTNFDFGASQFREYFKMSEKKHSFQSDSASCSSLTSESTKTSTCNKIKNLDETGNTLQTAATSNKNSVFDNLITKDGPFTIASSDSSLSVESKTSKAPILKNHTKENLDSNEVPSNSVASTSKMNLSEILSSEHAVSENDDTNEKSNLSLLQNNKHNSTDSNSNLQSNCSLDKKLISDNVTNDFSSSAIALAVGLHPAQSKSAVAASNTSSFAMHLSTKGTSTHVVSGNDDVSRKFDLSMPSTSGWTNPSSNKCLSKQDDSFKKSHSSSDDSLSIDRRTLLEKNEDDRNAKRIRKLEKLLNELDKAIKKCQKKELSLDDLDNDDSTYIQESKYKKRFIKIYKVLCKLKRVPPRTGRIIEKKFHYEGSRYKLINGAIEKLINKRKAHEKFPDYSEVHKVIKQVDEKHDLGLTEVEIANQAKLVFEDIGIELKNRRCRDEKEVFGCYLTDDMNLDDDPAERDENLKKTLEENNKKFNETINKIIDHYVEKQKEAPAEENDNGDDDEEEEEEEKDEDDDKEDYEDPIMNTHADSDDLPRTAPTSPAQNDRLPVVNILDKDDDIEIINYSDKSTDEEVDTKKIQTHSINIPNSSEPVVIEDSESSGDLPSIQELIAR